MNTVTYKLEAREVEWILFKLKFFRAKVIGAMLIGFACGRVLWLLGPTCAVLGIAVVLVFASFPLRLFLSLRKLIGTSTRATAETKLTYDESGVSLRGPGFKQQYAWSDFKARTQDKNHVLLHLDRMGNCVPIPKRAFTSEELAGFLLLAGLGKG